MVRLLIFVLIGLWLIGILTNHFFDGYIHLLLIGVVVTMMVQYFTENKLIT